MALVLIVLIAFGCSSATASNAAGVLVFGAPEELAAYRILQTAYEKAFPGRRVQLIEASDRTDLITRLSTSIAGGAPPDVFLMNYRFYGQFAAAGAISPVDARLAASPSLRASDLYPAALTAFRWQGKQMCLPQNVSSLVVYYNRDLFQRFGLAEPKPGWTWHDMIATAMGLTRDAAGNPAKGVDIDIAPQPVAVHGLGLEPQMIRLAPFVWSNGGSLVDDDTAPTRFTLDSPSAREVLQEFLNLSVEYGVVPSDAEVESSGLETRFVNGQLAMYVSSRRSTTTFRAIKDFDWDVAELPVYAQPAGILHSDAYCITRGARNADQAWHFIEWALGGQGAAIMAATGRTVPSNIAVAESAAFLDPAQRPRNAKVFLDAIAVVRPTPTISTWPEIEDVTGGILENALYHGDPIDRVLQDIDEQTRPLFARGVKSG